MQEGRAPLHYALERGQIEITVALLEAKADVKARDKVRRWDLCCSSNDVLYVDCKQPKKCASPLAAPSGPGPKFVARGVKSKPIQTNTYMCPAAVAFRSTKCA